MAKDKTKTGVPNKHLHARISYLHRAAVYLAQQNCVADTESQSNRKDGDLKDVSEAMSVSVNVVDQSAPIPGPKASTMSADSNTEAKLLSSSPPSFGGLPLHLSSNLTQVARKSQIRLHPSIKHALCKRCSTPLINGQTSNKSMENLSKWGRKPHADILVLECTVCGAVKRWPVGAKRQQRKKKRQAKQQSVPTAEASGTKAHNASG